jgi:hypothetical protein
MKRAFHFICLLGLPLLALAGEQPTCFESFGSGDNDSHTYTWIFYGHRNDKIAFIIFQTTHGTNTDYSQHIHLTMHSLNTAGCPNVCEGWIDMPDGTKRDLPSSKMVFEFTDGVFHPAPIDMLQDDLSRYIDSGHTNGWDTFTGLTVDGLKRFEKKIKPNHLTIGLQRTPL